MTPHAKNAYGRDAILTASPAALLTMLYDRLVLDLKRAELAQAGERWQDASTQLVHAQQIIAELMGSLNQDVWDGAKDLMALYLYLHQALVSGNINRDLQRTKEVLEIVVPLQQAWHQAAEQVPASALTDAISGRVSGVA